MAITRDGFYSHNDDINRRLPPVMMEQKNWACFKVSEPKGETGKRQKLPCLENGVGVRNEDMPSKLTTYTQERVGFRFMGKPDEKGRLIVFIDGDGKPDPKHYSFYRKIYDKLVKVTFVEESVSAELDGKMSWHAFGYAKLPIVGKDSEGRDKTARNIRELSIELYDRRRFCLTTGRGNNVPISNIQGIIDEILAYEAEHLAKKEKTITSKRTLARRTRELGNIKTGKVFLDDSDIPRVFQRLKWHRENKPLFKDVNDYTTWQRVVYALKSMIDKNGDRIISNGDIAEWCSSQPGFDNKAFHDILSGFKDGNQGVQDASFFKLSNERGFPKELDLQNRKPDTAPPRNTEIEKEKSTSTITANNYLKTFVPENARQVIPPADVTKWFPPVGEVNVIAGKPNVGKTSLLLDAVTKASHQNLPTLILSYDMRHEFLYQYLLAYEAKAEMVSIIDQPVSLHVIEDAIKTRNIKLLVADPLLDFFGVAADRFMINPLNGNEMEFLPDQQLSWVKAFRWMRPWLEEYGLSTLGTLHCAKGKFGHDLPHSTKLPAYLWNWWILYRKGISMVGFPEKWLADALESGNKNTRMIFQGKARQADGVEHQMYLLGDQVDKALLNPAVTFVPRLLTGWETPEEADWTNNDGDDCHFCPDEDAIMVRLSDNLSHGEEKSLTDICKLLGIQGGTAKAIAASRLCSLARSGRLHMKMPKQGCLSFRIKD